jgi:Fe-S-cluster containining protein
MLKQRTGDCIFLSSNTCTIYEIRPLTCRFYPFSLEEPVQGSYEFELTNEKCPGIGKGQLLNEEFFRDLLSTARKRIISTEC